MNYKQLKENLENLTQEQLQKLDKKEVPESVIKTLYELGSITFTYSINGEAQDVNGDYKDMLEEMMDVIHDNDAIENGDAVESVRTIKGHTYEIMTMNTVDTE